MTFFLPYIPFFPPSLLPSLGFKTPGADLHERALVDLGLHPTHDRPIFQGRDEPQGKAKGRKGGEDGAACALVLLFV